MDKVMEQLMEALTSPRMHEEFLSGLWDTIYSSVLATAAACLLGLFLRSLSPPPTKQVLFLITLQYAPQGHQPSSAAH